MKPRRWFRFSGSGETSLRNDARTQFSMGKLLALVAVWAFAFAALRWSGAAIIGAPWWAVAIFMGLFVLPVSVPLMQLVLVTRLVWRWTVCGAFAALLIAFVYLWAEHSRRTVTFHEQCFAAFVAAGYGASIGGCSRLCFREASRRTWPMALVWAGLALSFGVVFLWLLYVAGKT